MLVVLRVKTETAGHKPRRFSFMSGALRFRGQLKLGFVVLFPALFSYSVFSYKVYQLAYAKYSTLCFWGNWVIG